MRGLGGGCPKDTRWNGKSTLLDPTALRPEALKRAVLQFMALFPWHSRTASGRTGTSFLSLLAQHEALGVFSQEIPCKRYS